MRVVVIGAGASGLMAAGRAVERGLDTVIFDGNEKVGKKIYITGKGRCNITNSVSPDEFLRSVVTGRKFMFSSINGFTPLDTMKFFEKHGVKLKTERGNRVFPFSDKSSDIIWALKNFAGDAELFLKEKVTEVMRAGDNFIVVTNKQSLECDKVIIATGGKSYPATGSDGDGYIFARKFGHSVVPPVPALVPIKLKDGFCRELEGLSLKNIKLICDAGGKKFEQFGEILFTGEGISGPAVLTLSSLINRAKKVVLKLDFKPALTEAQLAARLLREFEDTKNKNIKNVMQTLLPSRLIKHFLNECGILEDKKINAVIKPERERIVFKLKNFPLTFYSLQSIELGVVTSGGVELSEINPKTMESKIVPGLFFVGEVLNVDALTGGFNLQIALSTGNAAGHYI